MNDTQKILLDMYSEISRILSDNNILFFVHFGTALGAVRHDGFIPWDNDIDLLVRDCDIPLINKVLSENLDASKYYYHPNIGDSHPHVVYRGDNFDEDVKSRRAIFIDLFQYTNYPSGKWGRFVFRAAENLEESMVFFLDHIPFIWLYRHSTWFIRWMHRIQRRHTPEKSDHVVLFNPMFKKYILPAEVFESVTMHRFEDIDVPLPSGYETLLSELYGDYMTPPPEDQRSGATGFPCNLDKDYFLETRTRD